MMLHKGVRLDLWVLLLQMYHTLRHFLNLQQFYVGAFRATAKFMCFKSQRQCFLLHVQYLTVFGASSLVQRAHPHQIGDTTLPRSDPNLSAPDKGKPLCCALTLIQQSQKHFESSLS